MMDMTMRKSLSRFRAKATLDTSFFLKPNKTILVDEALWTFAEIIAAGTAQGMRDAHVGPKVWICWILGTLTAEGFAERSIDKNGNCVFKSTPELVEDDRHRSVKLYDRRYFFSDGLTCH
jgi:hypothetical protein